VATSLAEFSNWSLLAAASFIFDKCKPRLGGESTFEEYNPRLGNASVEYGGESMFEECKPRLGNAT